MTGSIRLGHGNADVLHGSFQSVLRACGIGSQCGGQLVVQSIRRVIVDAALSLVSICGSQADGGQHGVGALRAIKAIQHTHMTLTIHDLVVHGNVSDAEVGELHALNGILAQLVNDSVVMQTGADVGFRIPHAVLAGFCDIVLVNGERRLLAGVDGRLCERCGDEAQSHNNGHEHGQYAMDLFHLVVSFLMLDFLQK